MTPKGIPSALQKVILSYVSKYQLQKGDIGFFCKLFEGQPEEEELWETLCKLRWRFVLDAVYGSTKLELERVRKEASSHTTAQQQQGTRSSQSTSTTEEESQKSSLWKSIYVQKAIQDRIDKTFRNAPRDSRGSLGKCP